ncbi:MAG: hypothetical protein A2W93_14530 [Bacteroidetes bacterium GWF2_43_63]|nr:MAG: hypothetical protein A2W94_01100 [Bacteroidetes bacterium GWE2_42_42]OFY52557.1 MAG: hypothetical protein A2W93_14530 [Bacteroidetes bacterium GWF2_43_63]HBG71465.1 hypothetical protein [Bacteroidales bacterium]HCB60783.1 hypothetical protein [Bacteroidales bacterium]HCY23492.1 hypothetical protein [Bacteroidales bacterium]
MKWIFLMLLVSVFTFSSCKCCKERKSNETAVTTTQGSTYGTVSHKFRPTGCNTVILVSESEQVLIPVEGLPESLDVDGKVITFDFTLLRMPQPEGCSTGQPAQLSNVAVK